jgi:hypothetical protein
MRRAASGTVSEPGTFQALPGLCVRSDPKRQLGELLAAAASVVPDTGDPELAGPDSAFLA